MNKPSTINIVMDKLRGQDTEDADKPLSEDAKQLLTEKLEIISKLNTGIWVIEFEKVDGTSAVMECTLDTRYLPPTAESSTKKMSWPDTIVRAYSVDRAGWRSFRVRSVNKMYRLPENL